MPISVTTVTNPENQSKVNGDSYTIMAIYPDVDPIQDNVLCSRDPPEDMACDSPVMSNCTRELKRGRLVHFRTKCLYACLLLSFPLLTLLIFLCLTSPRLALISSAPLL
jgi:hypothetical protein